MLTKPIISFLHQYFCQKEISRLHAIVKHLEYIFHLLELLYQLSAITNDDKKQLFDKSTWGLQLNIIMSVLNDMNILS